METFPLGSITVHAGIVGDVFVVRVTDAETGEALGEHVVDDLAKLDAVMGVIDSFGEAEADSDDAMIPVVSLVDPSLKFDPSAPWAKTLHKFAEEKMLAELDEAKRAQTEGKKLTDDELIAKGLLKKFQGSPYGEYRSRAAFHESLKKRVDAALSELRDFNESDDYMPSHIRNAHESAVAHALFDGYPVPYDVIASVSDGARDRLPRPNAYNPEKPLEVSFEAGVRDQFHTDNYFKVWVRAIQGERPAITDAIVAEVSGVLGVSPRGTTAAETFYRQESFRIWNDANPELYEAAIMAGVRKAVSLGLLVTNINVGDEPVVVRNGGLKIRTNHSFDGRTKRDVVDATSFVGSPVRSLKVGDGVLYEGGGKNETATVEAVYGPSLYRVAMAPGKSRTFDASQLKRRIVYKPTPRLSFTPRVLAKGLFVSVHVPAKSWRSEDEKHVAALVTGAALKRAGELGVADMADGVPPEVKHNDSSAVSGEREPAYFGASVRVSGKADEVATAAFDELRKLGRGAELIVYDDAGEFTVKVDSAKTSAAVETVVRDVVRASTVPSSLRPSGSFPLEPLVREVMRSPNAAITGWRQNLAEAASNRVTDGHSAIFLDTRTPSKIADFLRKPAPPKYINKEGVEVDRKITSAEAVEKVMTLPGGLSLACVSGYVDIGETTEDWRLIAAIHADGGMWAFDARKLATIVAAVGGYDELRVDTREDAFKVLFLIRDGSVRGVLMGMKAMDATVAHVKPCEPSGMVLREVKQEKGRRAPVRSGFMQVPNVERAYGVGFSCDRQELAAALARCNMVIDKRSSFPILQTVRITAFDGGVALDGFDLLRGIRVHVKASVTRKGEVAVNAAELTALCKSAPGEVSLETEGEFVRLIVSGVGYYLDATNADDWPLMNPPHGELRHEFDAGVIRNAMVKVEPFMSDDDTRPHLASACLIRDEGVLRAVATNGHTLAVQVVFDDPGPNVYTLTQADAVSVLLKLLDEATGTVKMHVGFRVFSEGPNIGKESTEPVVVYWTLPNGDWVSSRAVDAAFPSWKQVIPSDESRWEATVNRESFAEKLANVSKIAKNRTSGARCVFSRYVLALSSTDGEGTTSSAEVDVDLTLRDEVKTPWTSEGSRTYAENVAGFGINAQYAVAALRVMTSKTVTLKFNGELDPIVFVEPGYTAVVMPMRV